jgi:hypothetical protein
MVDIKLTEVDKATWLSAKQLMGERITQIVREHYVFKGSADTNFGALQLGFESGRVATLDMNSWEEAVVITHESLQEDFTGELDAATQQFIEESGQWITFTIEMVYNI